jgi:hypothetical protein
MKSLHQFIFAEISHFEILKDDLHAEEVTERKEYSFVIFAV